MKFRCVMQRKLNGAIFLCVEYSFAGMNICHWHPLAPVQPWLVRCGADCWTAVSFVPCPADGQYCTDGVQNTLDDRHYLGQVGQEAK